MNKSHQTQIIPRKGKHICINKNIEKYEKTTIKSLMLNPCPHNSFSLALKNSTISQNSHSHDNTLFLLHQE